jgi:hypothetical protein
MKETKRKETKRKETKRKETKRKETKRKETKRKETKRNRGYAELREAKPISSGRRDQTALESFRGLCEKVVPFERGILMPK